MKTLKQARGKKVHNRNISVSTYTYKDNSIIVEGELIDDRLTPSYTYLGEKRLPKIIHYMVIRLLVDQSFTIKDIEVEMPTTSLEECINTRNSLERIREMKIAKGFTLKIKDMYDGGKGCAHLVELLLAMAPAAFQGFGAASFQTKAPKEIMSTMGAYMVDTCWVWRRDGTAMKKLMDQISSR